MANQRSYFFGYNIVAAAFIAQFVAMGIYSYVLGAFMDPMTAELDWSRSEFTLARTIGQVVMAVSGIYIGVHVDRAGGRRIMLIGAGVLGLTLILHAYVTTLYQWWLLNGILFTLGCAMTGNLVVNVTLAKWFVERRGLMVAIAAMGVSFAGVALTPLTTWLIDSIGWRDSWLWLGGWTMLMICPVALAMRRTPEDYGLHPDGLSATDVAEGLGERARLELAGSYTRAQAIRTFSFFALVVAFGFFSINIVVLLLLTIPFLADEGLSRGDAAFALVVASIPAMLSKPFWGQLIDRTAPKPLAALSASLAGIALFFIVYAAATQEVWLIYGGYAILGLAWGGMIPMQEVIWTSFFGRRFIGAIRGAAMPFALALGALAPVLVALYRDLYGDYNLALMTVAGLNVMSGVLIFFAPPPTPKVSPVVQSA